MTDTVYDPLGLEPGDWTPPAEQQPATLPSSLDDLRAAVEQSEQVAEVEFQDFMLYGPGKFIRLVCSTEIDQAGMKAVQRAGLPPEQRKKRIPDPRKMDEAVVMATLIARQTTRVELLNGDGRTYRPVDGDLNDPALLAQLGVLDPVMGVRRIFGNKDAYLLRAGEALVNACGYGERKPGEPLDDEDDPT